MSVCLIDKNAQVALESVQTVSINFFKISMKLTYNAAKTSNKLNDSRHLISVRKSNAEENADFGHNEDKIKVTLLLLRQWLLSFRSV